MKFIKLILFLLPLFPLAIHPQDGSAKVRMSATANVKEFIEIITLADINVGTVIPTNEIMRLDPRTAQGAGILLIQGRAWSQAQVTFSNQVEMTNVTSNAPLLVEYFVSGNQENQQSGSLMFISNPQSVTLNGDGEYYLYIGCSFSLAEVQPGQYDGDFVIEVDYN